MLYFALSTFMVSQNNLVYTYIFSTFKIKDTETTLDSWMECMSEF